MNNDRSFALVGLGNMGLSVLGAVLFARWKSIAIDKDELKVKVTNDGIPIVPEEGLKQEIEDALKTDRFYATTDISKIKDYRVIFIAVQTPVIEKECDYSVLLGACSEVFQNACKDATVIIGSTLFPGGMKKVLEIAKDRPDIELIYEPVFLRAGMGIEDYTLPGKCVLGVQKELSEQATLFFNDIVEGRKTQVSYEVAEWIKLVHNMFLCVKVTFANEVAEMCPSPGKVIRTVFSEDWHGRILTNSHLLPGPPYSGPCLPKDMKMAMNIIENLKLKPSLTLIPAAKSSNEMHITEIAGRLWQNSEKGNIGIVGCAFRPGFNELRDSLFLTLLQRFQYATYVKAYDPAFENINKEDYVLACRQDKLLLTLHDMVSKPLEEVWQCDAVLINRRMSDEELKRVEDLPRPYVVDLYKFFGRI